MQTPYSSSLSSGDKAQPQAQVTTPPAPTIAPENRPNSPEGIVPRQERHKREYMDKIESIRYLSRAIAHDLNNALMPIQTFSEFLISNPGILDNPAETLGILNDIHNASKDIAHTLHGLGSTSLADKESPRENVHLGGLLKESVESALAFFSEPMQAEAPAITISPRMDAAPSMHCHARQMHDAITSIVQDILITQAGSAIAIDSHQDSDGLVIVINATPPGKAQAAGTPPNKSFFRAADTEDISAGLVMAYSIIRGHNGHLDIERSKNGGKICFIRLPV